MASFDIVSKVDPQTMDNALNVAKKEITTRYDFRDSKTEIELDKKANILHITTENSMRVNAIVDVLISRMVKQNLDGRALDLSKEEYASGAMVKKDIPLRNGVDKEVSKKIIKLIKDSKLKVTASIMDDMVRVTAKKIDDLQGVIALLRKENFEVPLQFTNMKS